MLALAGSVTLLAFICPNLVRVAGGQCVIGRWDNYKKQGYCIAIAENGRLEFRIGQKDQDREPADRDAPSGADVVLRGGHSRRQNRVALPCIRKRSLDATTHCSAR